MAGKPIRLGKAAGELNVGLSTLVEFLDSKGIKIDNNPNTKLEGEHYDLLRQEFAADHDLKEKSKMTTVRREKRETISLKDTREEEKAPSESEAEEEAPSPKVVETPKAGEAAPVEKQEEEQKPEPKVEEEKENAGDVKVQVIGKIDLDKINSKTRPDKKKKEEVAEEPAAETAPKEEEKPKPVAEEKK